MQGYEETLRACVKCWRWRNIFLSHIPTGVLFWHTLGRRGKTPFLKFWIVACVFFSWAAFDTEYIEYIEKPIGTRNFIFLHMHTLPSCIRLTGRHGSHDEIHICTLMVYWDAIVMTLFPLSTHHTICTLQAVHLSLSFSMSTSLTALSCVYALVRV